MNDYDFGNFVYQLRVEKGLSQSQLGDMMGVSNKAVSKWEMGISKPRPDMLAALASFFDVTVDELLAGRRNEAVEQQESKKVDDTALKRWAGEYRKKKRQGRAAVVTAFLLPILLFVATAFIFEFCPVSDVVGPIVIMSALFAEAIDIALIFVFYGSARRLKRILYSTYPQQAKEISEMIAPKKESVPVRKLTPKQQKWLLIGTLIAIVLYVAVVQVVMLLDDNVEYDPSPLIWLAKLLVTIAFVYLFMILFMFICVRRIKRLGDALVNQRYEYVIKHAKRLMFIKKGNKLGDSVTYSVAIAYLETQDYEKFLEYINQITFRELINVKYLWLAVYSALVEDYEQFAHFRDMLQNSEYEEDKEKRLKVLDLLYRHRKENYQLTDEEKQSLLKWSNVLKSLFDIQE